MDDGELCFLVALLKRKLEAGFLKIQKKKKKSLRTNFSLHLSQFLKLFDSTVFGLLFFNLVVGSREWILIKNLLIQHLWPSPMHFMSHWLHKYCSKCAWTGHLASPLRPLLSFVRNGVTRRSHVPRSCLKSEQGHE